MTESGDDRDERTRVASEISARLSRNGVTLSGDESLEELGNLLESVERFERAVQLRGGDLMVDGPVNGAAPAAPDNTAFVLPLRQGSENVSDFIVRIEKASNHIRSAPEFR